MGIVKTKGIIIAENNNGDFDKMLTMLTPGLRKNWVCCKRSKKTKKLAYGRHSIFMFWRIHFIQR